MSGRICSQHEEVVLKIIESRGLDVLIKPESVDRILDAKLEGLKVTNDMFDPMVAMKIHWYETVKGIWGEVPDCPLCVLVAKAHGFVLQKELEQTADGMRAWALKEKLITTT